ncbi:YeeE/YedE family protein [Catenovulum adriaticum]|uniref:YeeE/YedE family protein n=1 Tax=Catenovulum adriaticum TaxID=2984846 RepID=A0ABY7AM26_9ALTE|nr:YeeE/YedE family protein [Catenovulum sp. TS8]WAJ70610.1 YeeE/YedE family protein [Catenovulum sp. TS8]
MKSIIQLIVALLSGVIFGIGLIVSQMANPQKVLNFLDISGHWDPSLAFVMGSALVVFISAYHLLIKTRNKPILCDKFDLPANKKIDKPLVLGGMIFGAGWGIAGICPGPALVNILGDTSKISVFIVFMALGMFLTKYVNMAK